MFIAIDGTVATANEVTEIRNTTNNLSLDNSKLNTTD